MGTVDSMQLASYTLQLAPDGNAPAQVQGKAFGRSLTEPLLIRKVLWFCRIRWIIIAMLVACGLAGGFEDLLNRLGLRLPGLWPLVAAGVLAIGNTVFLLHACRLKVAATAGQIMGNLWAQIALDLLVLTGVVHVVGSMSTYVAFAYLFHIVLACFFLARWQSFAVLVLATALYAACIVAESKNIFPAGGTFFGMRSVPQAPPARSVFMFNYLLGLAIWTVVWHLASHLSEMLRDRNVELAETNSRRPAQRLSLPTPLRAWACSPRRPGGIVLRPAWKTS